MSDGESKDASVDDSSQEPAESDQPSAQSDDAPTDSDQSTQQSDEQPPEETDQPAEQAEEQPAESDQSEVQPTDSDQPAKQPEEQSTDADQQADQSEEQPADSDQAATSESGTDTVALADAGGGGEGGGSGTVSGGGPTVVDPFPVVNSIGFSPPDASLATCINAASQDPNVKDLCTGVIDLTGLGASAATLPYVGHNESERLYVGSIAKIYPLLAAFELRQRVTLQANAMIFVQGLSTSTPGWQTKVFDTIQKAWQPQLDAKFPALPKGTHPNFSKILELAPDGTASFRKEFTDWIKAATKQNDEAAAGQYIPGAQLSLYQWRSRIRRVLRFGDQHRPVDFGRLQRQRLVGQRQGRKANRCEVAETRPCRIELCRNGAATDSLRRIDRNGQSGGFCLKLGHRGAARHAMARWNPDECIACSVLYVRRWEGWDRHMGSPRPRRSDRDLRARPDRCNENNPLRRRRARFGSAQYSDGAAGDRLPRLHRRAAPVTARSEKMAKMGSRL
jgi:hypothetical protein